MTTENPSIQYYFRHTFSCGHDLFYRHANSQVIREPGRQYPAVREPFPCPACRQRQTPH